MSKPSARFCRHCEEELTEDGDANWVHTSDGARFCERPAEADEKPASMAEPLPLQCEDWTDAESERWLVDMFEWENCGTCQQDHTGHDCVPGPLGLPFARCKPRGEFHLIALDETEYWELPEYKGMIERIETVYLYDRLRPVYCCEMTPSYELLPIETRAILPYDLSDEMREEIDETVRGNTDHSEVTYMHCRTVDALAEKLKLQRFRTADLDWSDFDGDTYEELIEAIEEDCRCNSRL